MKKFLKIDDEYIPIMDVAGLSINNSDEDDSEVEIWGWLTDNGYQKFTAELMPCEINLSTTMQYLGNMRVDTKKLKGYDLGDSESRLEFLDAVCEEAEKKLQPILQQIKNAQNAILEQMDKESIIIS